MAQDVAIIGFGCCTMARIWRLYGSYDGIHMGYAVVHRKNGMDLILLCMASRWVQDGFNIGFGCCMLASIWLMMASYGSRCELTSALDAV